MLFLTCKNSHRKQTILEIFKRRLDNVQFAIKTGNVYCREISGSHSSVTKDVNLLRCYSVPLGKHFSLFLNC